MMVWEKEWFSRLGYQGDADYENYERIKEILGANGNSVERPLFAGDGNLGKLLSRGYFRGGEATLIRGQDNRCFANSASIWSMCHGANDLHICIGYGLLEGEWWQHAWLVHRHDGQEEVIETTMERERYFGFEMTVEEAEKLAENELSDPEYEDPYSYR